ncbi:MAG: MOSC domain-containing protein [Sulfurimonadaceae bacterium]
MKSESRIHTYPVTIHKLFSSPQHNYFTRPKFEVGNAPTITHQKLYLKANRGIEEDRFETGRYPITFFSLEVAQEMEKELARNIEIEDFRRNIIISGVNLCELIGKRFSIGGVSFEGIAHCNPCTWMNAMIGKGAYGLMKGRGGLRAKVIEGGEITPGETVLQSDTILIIEATTPMTISRLPKG